MASNFPAMVKKRNTATLSLAVFSIFVSILYLILILNGLNWEPDNFSRFGSLMVASGVLLFAVQNSLQQWWFGVSKDADAITQGGPVLLALEDTPSPYKFDGFEMSPDDEDGIIKLGELAKIKLKTLSWSMRMVEIALLFIGTLVWGYGHLFHCWYNDNGWTTC